MSGKGFDANKYVKKNLNAETVGKLKEVFNVFDYDGSGSISSEELINTIRALNMESQASQILNIVNHSGHTGDLDFAAFLEIFGFGADSANEVTLQTVYEEFDPKGHGFGAEDFERVAGSVGEHFSAPEIDQTIDFADKDRDGVISYEEFCNVVTKVYPKVWSTNIIYFFKHIHHTYIILEITNYWWCPSSMKKYKKIYYYIEGIKGCLSLRSFRVGFVFWTFVKGICGCIRSWRHRIFLYLARILPSTSSLRLEGIETTYDQWLRRDRIDSYEGNSFLLTPYGPCWILKKQKWEPLASQEAFNASSSEESIPCDLPFSYYSANLILFTTCLRYYA